VREDGMEEEWTAPARYLADPDVDWVPADVDPLDWDGTGNPLDFYDP
jgi:hypothetical protein